MVKFRIYLSSIFLILSSTAFAQVEHTPIYHPVYNFLERMEIKGFLQYFSFSNLPLQRKEVQSALEKIAEKSSELTESETNILKRFQVEFEVLPRDNAVIFYSKSDKVQVLSKEFLSDKEKLIYHYNDSLHNLSVYPLGGVDFRYYKNDTEAQNALIGQLGVLLHGTLSGHVGYALQATNGILISGDKELALRDERLNQNIKFRELNSDIDFTESHVRFDYDWFYAFIARQRRLLGSGMNQRVFIAETAPPFDELSLGARFSNFEYRFTHGSLLAIPTSETPSGFKAEIPPKYLAMHRFSLRPSWGEISFWEGIIYYNRYPDLAYLNPLSFYKSLEHSLRDRDNSTMGLDATVRPIKNVELKGSFLLDDIIFRNIGKGFWSNKWAYNLSFLAALPWNFDIGLEYSRVEPYTFSHFDVQKSMTSDSRRLGSIIPPNSDISSIRIRNFWFGSRYPIILSLSHMRHGDNIYDSEGKIVKNVGGDALQTRIHPRDDEFLGFLEGIRNDRTTLSISMGYELARGFNLQFAGVLETLNSSDPSLGFSLIFRYGDFY